MSPEEVRQALLQNLEKRVRITFGDDVIQFVDVNSVDDEGVLHSRPNGIDPR